MYTVIVNYIYKQIHRDNKLQKILYSFIETSSLMSSLMEVPTEGPFRHDGTHIILRITQRQLCKEFAIIMCANLI